MVLIALSALDIALNVAMAVAVLFVPTLNMPFLDVWGTARMDNTRTTITHVRIVAPLVLLVTAQLILNASLAVD